MNTTLRFLFLNLLWVTIAFQPRYQLQIYLGGWGNYKNLTDYQRFSNNEICNCKHNIILFFSIRRYIPTPNNLKKLHRIIILFNYYSNFNHFNQLCYYLRFSFDYCSITTRLVTGLVIRISQKQLIEPAETPCLAEVAHGIKLAVIHWSSHLSHAYIVYSHYISGCSAKRIDGELFAF